VFFMKSKYQGPLARSSLSRAAARFPRSMRLVYFLFHRSQSADEATHALSLKDENVRKELLNIFDI